MVPQTISKHTNTPNLSTLQNRFPEIQILNRDSYPEDESAQFTALDIESTTAQQLSGQHGDYRGQLGLLTLRYNQVASLALEGANSFQQKYKFGLIEYTDIQPDNVDLTVTIATAQTELDPNSSTWTQVPSNDREYLLPYNPIRNEALLPHSLDHWGKTRRIWNAKVRQYHPTFQRTDHITDEWLANAHLLIVDKKITHYQNQDFSIKNIPL